MVTEELDPRGSRRLPRDFREAGEEESTRSRELITADESTTTVLQMRDWSVQRSPSVSPVQLA